MQRPKIGLVTSVIDNRGGRGTAMVARRLLESLPNYTNEFQIILIHHEPSDDPLYTQYPELIIPHLPKPLDRQIIREALFWISLWFRGVRFDVVHFLNPRVWPSYLLMPSKNIVITAFEAGSMLGLTKPTLGDRLFKVTNRFLHARMTRVIASSNYGRTEIITHYKLPRSRVVSIPLGVDERFAPVSIDNSLEKELLSKYGVKRPYLLSVARFDPHKNIIRLVEAFHTMHSSYPSMNLLLVGGKHMPEYSEKVMAAIEETGLRKNIQVAPFIPDEDMPLVYSAAEGFVYPSYHEGFGLPILESMACGTPVATGNLTASPETAGDAAILFDPHNTQEMAEAMSQLLEEKTRKEFSEKGQKRARAFKWAEMANEVFALYRALLSGN